MKTYKLLFILSSFTAIIFSACTKADFNDNVTKGDPPPIAGGYVNSRGVATSNLVAYWSFDNTLIDSVSGTAGISTNTSFGQGIEGQALQGADSGYVITNPSDAIKNLGAYTISYWVKTSNNSTGIAGMVNFSDSTGFWGNVNTFFENGGTATKARFKALFSVKGRVFDTNIQEVENGFNRWMYVALTYDGIDSFTVYIDGTKKGGTGNANFTANNGAPLAPAKFQNFGSIIFGAVQFETKPSETSGSTAQPWANYLTGQLDEVRIYNKALSPLEISAIQKLQRQGR